MEKVKELLKQALDLEDMDYRVEAKINDALNELEAMKQRTCEGCKYEYSDELEEPCKNCKRNTPDFYAKDNS